MTVNRIVYSDLPAPFADRAVDAWNSFAATMTGLVNFLQPSVDSVRVESDGTASLYDRKALAWWRTADPVAPGTLGPVLKSVGSRYPLEWPDTSDTNPLRSPAGVSLPASGTIILVVNLTSYDSAKDLFASSTTTGNYINIAINASGEIEATGTAGATLAKTADITPYSGPMLIMFSYGDAITSHTTISVNGTVGATTGSNYTMTSNPLDLGLALDDDDQMLAALILDVEYHDAAYDTERAAFVIATGQAFSTPFTIDWDFADLPAGKLWMNIEPSTVADGAVTTLTDSASGFAVTEATFGPSKASADFNGLPSLTFVSADTDRLRNLSLPGVFPVLGTESQMFGLVDVTASASDTTDQTIIGYGATGTNNSRSLRRISNGTLQTFRATTNNSGGHADSTVDASGIHVIEGEWKAGVEKVRVDSVLGGTTTTAFNTPATRVSIGASPSASGTPVGFADVKIARLIGTKEITDAERDLITGKLAFLGGIQDQLPDGHPYQRATFT